MANPATDQPPPKAATPAGDRQKERRLAKRLLLGALLLVLLWLGFKMWRIASLAQSLLARQTQAEQIMANGFSSAYPDAIEALVYGVALSVLGTAWLALGVNAITAVLGGLCVLSYVLLYTPMKRLSPWNTAVGAVPGAIPPMMGWTAVTGTIGVEAWVLFAILFIWQYPHFLAIGWLFKDDYAGAGYRMLSAVDPAGERTARQVLVNAALLVLVSLLPYGLEQAGLVYASGALLLGLGLFGLGILFHRRRDRAVAALLLKGTILHITLLMTLLVVDRV